MKKDKLVVYAKGKINNNIILSLVSLFILGSSVLLFIEDKILQGSLVIIGLLFKIINETKQRAGIIEEENALEPVL